MNYEYFMRRKRLLVPYNVYDPSEMHCHYSNNVDSLNYPIAMELITVSLMGFV
jgi:hypothetical protein